MISKLREGRSSDWIPLIVYAGFAQIVIQMIGLISGIFIIRLLSTQEYALYTIANTMLGTMTVLADGGISAGVMSASGRDWQNKKKLGAIIATGFLLRKRFAIVSVLISTPALAYLLLKNGASWQNALLISSSLLPALLSTISGSLLEIPVKLHQRIRDLQKIQVAMSSIRSALVISSIAFFPFAFLALLGAGLSQAWMNFRLRILSGQLFDKSEKIDDEVKSEIIRVAKRILPGSLYYCLSGQITIWLLSLFGTATAVAQIGALSRLAVVFTVVSTLINTIVVPRFSRARPRNNQMIKLYSLIVLGLILFLLSAIMVSIIFPTEILWVLGDKYHAMSHETILMVISQSLGLLVGVAYSLNVSRGEIVHPWFSIAFAAASQIFFIYLFGASTVEHVLFTSIALGACQAVLLISYGFIKFSSRAA